MKTTTFAILFASTLMACSGSTDLGGEVPGAPNIPPPDSSEQASTTKSPDTPAEPPSQAGQPTAACEPAWTTYSAAQLDNGSSDLWWAMSENHSKIGGSNNATVIMAAVPDETWQREHVFAWVLRIRQDKAYRDQAKAGGQQWHHTAFILLIDAVAGADLGTLPERIRRRILEPAHQDFVPAKIEQGGSAMWQATLDQWPNIGDISHPDHALAAIPDAVWSNEDVFAFSLRIRQDAAYRDQAIAGARKWNHTAHEVVIHALSVTSTQALPKPLLARITAGPRWRSCL